MPPWWVVGLIRLWVMEVCSPAVGFVILYENIGLGVRKQWRLIFSTASIEKNIVVDNNTTTIAKVKNEVKHYTMKNFANALYSF